MKKLIKIRLVQFFLYETLDIDIGMTCGIFGANGSGKSSLLDAVQIVMLGANEGSGNAGIAFNAQADETNHNSRSIRAYCLGQYGHAPDARVRDSADTYITLLWEDSQTQERISTGIHIHADAAQSYVQGRYIFSGELTLDDHLDKSDGATRPKSWLHFKQMLIQRAPGEDPLYDNAKRFVEALLFRLRGAGGVPRLDAYRQAFRFGLRMKFDKSVDDIVRRQVLEARPTHIQKFRQVLSTFQEMAALVREVQTKLAEARDIEADFASAQRYQRQAVALHVLAEEAACTAAEAAYAAAVSAEESAATALNIARERQQNIATALQSADEAARRSAEARDRHASHGDRAVLEEALVATRARLASDSARLARALGAIASAIDIQIPGKLLASDDSSTAYRALQTLLGDSQWTDETVIAVAHQALRAAKALHNEIFKEMQAAGSALTKAEREYNAAKEAQQRAVLGKSPLAPNVLILQRELADANIEAIPVCDVVRIDDPDWQPIIESFLGATNIQALLVQETDERRAFQIARQSRTYDSKIVRASKYAHRASPPAGSVAELIRGKTGRVNGNLVALLTVMKGLPLAYNKDMQEDKEGVFDSVATALASLEILKQMLKTAKFNEQNMLAMTRRGHLTATDLADYLVREKNVPFRRAHFITGKAVAYAENLGLDLSELNAQQLASVDESLGGDAVKFLDLRASKEARSSQGGTANASVNVQIEFLNEWLKR